MEHAYFRIGEVSQFTGVSKDTLHFYNKIGLLVPDYTDPDNQYRYYSLKNLWQLDIITTCRKLDIPLETIRKILSMKDNRQITKLLMEYRREAIRLSEYYRRVAEDILWYDGENERTTVRLMLSMQKNSASSSFPISMIIIARSKHT